MECQDDVLAVSRIAEDIRDALLDYQVGEGTALAVFGSRNWGLLTGGTTTGDIRSECQANCKSLNLCSENVSDVDLASQDACSSLLLSP